MIILHKCCDPILAKNKELPRDSYLVGYFDNDNLVYDIVQSGSQSIIFDYYYDNYRNVQSIKWTEGIVNPKMYGYVSRDNKKKK